MSGPEGRHVRYQPARIYFGCYSTRTAVPLALTISMESPTVS